MLAAQKHAFLAMQTMFRRLQERMVQVNANQFAELILVAMN
tara:strand:- start:135 stop:257 length:123 start_codon:yes stop_codon:yes gene_type:complete